MKTLIAAAVLALTSTAALADRYDDRYYDSRYETRYYDTRYDDRYDNRYDNRRGRCDRCGVVLDINRYGGHGNRHSNAGGTVLGALVGGAIGNQVGKGDGRKAATVAGAVIGGVAGNRIDDRNGDGSRRYEILVRMDDGRRVVIDQNDLNGVREGSRVYVRNGRARLL
ncbi:MAG TPA: glycine zipper 2TM domain-containing protein [Xanthomonadales bacterium]|nr:glycine zipper 2TM domain-containing protein [Xanthomonadales bacterium]